MANVSGFIDHTGTYRALGLVIKPLVGAPRYRDTNRLVTESDWIEFDAWPDVITVKDQMQTNSCNPHALSLSMEQARWVTGQDHVRLDPWSLYAALCQGDDSARHGHHRWDRLLKRFGCPAFGAIVPGTYGTQGSPGRRPSGVPLPGGGGGRDRGPGRVHECGPASGADHVFRVRRE